LKATQTARVTGKDMDNGATVDAKQARPEKLTLAAAPSGNQAALKELLTEVRVPPLKPGSSDDMAMVFSVIPPFSPDALKKYEDKGPDDLPLKKAIHKARLALWAISQRQRARGPDRRGRGGPRQAAQGG